MIPPMIEVIYGYDDSKKHRYHGHCILPINDSKTGKKCSLQDADFHGSGSAEIRENPCPISFYANLVQKIHVGIELAVACITISENAEEGNQFILLLEPQRPRRPRRSWGAWEQGCKGATQIFTDFPGVFIPGAAICETISTKSNMSFSLAVFEVFAVCFLK